MFHSQSILNSTFPTPSTFPYEDRKIDLKSLPVCLINDYSLIADLHILVYGRAECASISLECTKVKLLILNNFVCSLVLLYLYSHMFGFKYAR